jgi:hypothetical protein
MVIGATRTTLSTVGVRPEVLWWHKPGCGIVDGGCAVHRGGSQRIRQQMQYAMWVGLLSSGEVVTHRF